MHARESEVLVKDIKRSKFTVDWPVCSLVRHRVLGYSKCLADKGRILLGALAACFFLTKSGVRTICLECIHRPILEGRGRFPRRVRS